MDVFDLIRIQLMLLLILLIEPPGIWEDDRVKTISDGLREHTGVGAAMFVTLVDILKYLQMHARFAILALVLVWIALVGFLGILYYPNTEKNAHTMYATMALTAPLMLQTQLVLEGKYSVSLHTIVAWLLLASIGLSYIMWSDATGILELVYLGILWTGWIEFEKANG